MSLFNPAPQHKTFALGLSISILVLASFFVGALADRLFVVKPLDYLAGRRAPVSSTPQNKSGSLLGSLISGQAIDVADVSEVAAESVVTVSIRRQQRVIETVESGLFGGLGVVLPGQERVEEITQDIGTGFVVEGGLIVTNRHVVLDNTAEYKIIDKHDQEYLVTDIYRDPSVDMAILKIDKTDLPALAMGDSEQLRVGQGVIAIGTALGTFRHTVTTGVVSGLGRGVDATDGRGLESLEDVIQTDAAINPGNSGGPLLDLEGRVIGVNVAVSAVGQNIGFAIPVNIVRDSIQNFNQTGQFSRAFLGIKYRIITQESAIANNVPQGAYLSQIVSGSVADQAGLQVGDIITEFGGESLQSDDANLAALINSHKIGDRVKIKFWRSSELLEAEVVLQEAE